MQLFVSGLFAAWIVVILFCLWWIGVVLFAWFLEHGNGVHVFVLILFIGIWIWIHPLTKV